LNFWKATEQSQLLNIADILRDSAFEQLIRLATGNKYFLYEEEKPGFKVPKYE
jgi:hypothetical protein